MDEKSRYILEEELKGTRIVDIAKALDCSTTNVNYYRNKPDYQKERENRLNVVNNRSQMTPQKRVENMIIDVISALEEELLKAPLNKKIGYINQLKELAIVVGKPDKVGELGVLEVPALLTPEAFNRGDINDDKKVAEQPFKTKDLASLEIKSGDEGGPFPHESLSSRRDGKTPTPVYDNESYPQPPDDEIPEDEWPDIDPLEEI